VTVWNRSADNAHVLDELGVSAVLEQRLGINIPESWHGVRVDGGRTGPDSSSEKHAHPPAGRAQRVVGAGAWFGIGDNTHRQRGGLI
jgi:hypothetical protein